MNFQTVEQANGNLTAMSGTFIEIGGTQFTTNQKAKAICKVRDIIGATHNVHIYQGKGQLPTPQNLNQTYQFNLSTFQGTYQNKPYTGYSGFWSDPAQAGQNVTQDTSQGSQQAAQATTPPQTDKAAPAWQPLDREHVEKDVICALLAARNRAKPEEVKKWADYIMSGVHPDGQPQAQNNPDFVGDNPPKPKDDDIPW